MPSLGRLLGLTPSNLFSAYVAGSLAVAALVLLALPAALALEALPVIAWSLGLPLLAVTLLAAVLFSHLARRENRRRDDLLTGPIWARWRYNSAEHEQLATREWAQTRAQVRQSGVSALLAGLIGGGTFAISGMGQVASLAFGGTLTTLLLVSGLVISLRGRSRYETRRGVGREVIFGPHAILRDGMPLPLSDRATRLMEVTIIHGDAAPSLLRLERKVERRTRSNEWWEISRRYWATETTELPIPAAEVASAAALVEQYRRAYSLPAMPDAPRPGPMLAGRAS